MSSSERSPKFHKSNKHRPQWERLQCQSRSFPALAVLRWPWWLTSHGWRGACQEAAFAQAACCRFPSEDNFTCGGAALRPELFFFETSLFIRKTQYFRTLNFYPRAMALYFPWAVLQVLSEYLAYVQVMAMAVRAIR